MTTYPMDVLAARAAALADLGPRRLLGIVGPPGAGKSTLAERIVEAVGPSAVLVPMDGYHLAEAELHRLGRHDRKGAIDTFDAAGYASILGRLAAGGPETVYAPAFHREIEEPVAGSIPVPPEVRLVVTEGNYLLVPEEPWSGVRLLLDEVWYLDLDEEERLRRLVARHMAYGRSQAEAKARSFGSDQVNAELIATTRSRADLVVRLV
ncbi:nucleoside/nucleotide kinase family protein [Asanoa iriomotensis]|uniref:Nucleoside/nucleotide kinase family protein n=2 Tax=Asanoa iriomotensis TaxID=234613 RepID=A0ABQ4CBG9_9ACTN|nr:nucleoside/nucleotide kinase family protein [Asanoa iriomotensis]